MEQLTPIINEIVAFFKSDSFKSIVSTITTLAKSIDYSQIIAALKKIIELVGTLAK